MSSWLLEIDHQARAPFTFRLIGEGQSNITIGVEDLNGKQFVLRRPPLGPLIPSAHDVIREQMIMRRLRDTDVPVPNVLGVCEEPLLCDAPLVALEFIEGTVIEGSATAAELSASARRSAGLSLAETLAQVHAVDVNRLGLNSLASHKPYAPRQIRRWSRQWTATRTRDQPKVEELARRFEGGAESESGLLHGDFHLRNVIVDPSTGGVRAVLDWELSTLGAPLADLGTLMAYWPELRDDPPAVINPAPLVDGFPTRAELVERYSAQSGRDVESVTYWQALAYWKIAIIGEGVRRRALEPAKPGAYLDRASRPTSGARGANRKRRRNLDSEISTLNSAYNCTKPTIG